MQLRDWILFGQAAPRGPPVSLVYAYYCITPRSGPTRGRVLQRDVSTTEWTMTARRYEKPDSLSFSLV